VNKVPTDIVIDGSKYSGSTVNSPSLTIHRVDSSDVGYYTCYGSNRVSKIRYLYNVNIFINKILFRLIWNPALF
jgi:hypothetical protein